MDLAPMSDGVYIDLDDGFVEEDVLSEDKIYILSEFIGESHSEDMISEEDVYFLLVGHAAGYFF